ncbi:hypothetical protein [Arthrobacter sp. ISL-28]|uniref:hypothetical protein n=1 Tax=Arthrobacter sp. ISL-28 TaxID=2819108 RepID=UPI001BEBACF5|nr:hypothetical protein [Arthrobacter sp. ISL-28]MBT2520346.1 hypothetical protein [Arthrobacter sp. ISL-28]
MSTHASLPAASRRTGNWPDPVLGRIGNWPDPMAGFIGTWPDPMARGSRTAGR